MFGGHNSLDWVDDEKIKSLLFLKRIAGSLNSKGQKGTIAKPRNHF
jgi:hypothetical protein